MGTTKLNKTKNPFYSWLERKKLQIEIVLCTFAYDKWEYIIFRKFISIIFLYCKSRLYLFRFTSSPLLFPLFSCIENCTNKTNICLKHISKNTNSLKENKEQRRIKIVKKLYQKNSLLFMNA